MRRATHHDLEAKPGLQMDVGFTTCNSHNRFFRYVTSDQSMVTCQRCLKALAARTNQEG